MIKGHLDQDRANQRSTKKPANTDTLLSTRTGTSINHPALTATIDHTVQESYQQVNTDFLQQDITEDYTPQVTEPPVIRTHHVYTSMQEISGQDIIIKHFAEIFTKTSVLFMATGFFFP
jgi:hypothetical protein